MIQDEEFQKLRKRCQELEEYNTTLAQSVAKSAHNFDELYELNTKLMARFSELRREVNIDATSSMGSAARMARASMELLNRATRAETEVGVLRGHVLDLEKENARYRERLREETIVRSGLEDKMEELKREKREAETRIATLEMELELKGRMLKEVRGS